METANTNLWLVPLVLSAPHAQVINPGRVDSVLTALPLGDKRNPAIIFGEQEILISPLSGAEKAQIMRERAFFQCSAA